jgi:hypothetical protein
LRGRSAVQAQAPLSWDQAARGEIVDEKDFRRRQARGQFAAALAVGDIAVGADLEALRGQPFHCARALEAGARQDGEIGEAHLLRLRRFVGGAVILHGHEAVIDALEPSARLLEDAMDEAAPGTGRRRKRICSGDHGYISCRWFFGS